MKNLVLAVMVMSAMLMSMKPCNALTCQQVDTALIPCIPYLTSGGMTAGTCCAGVSNLKNIVTNTAERRSACNCVKDALERYQNIRDDAASSLPTKCGVPVTVPISKTVDCNRIA